MKILELLNSTKALSELIKIEMPIKKSYELRKFINEVEEKLKAFNQTKDDLIKKYGEEKNGNFNVKEENLNLFYKDLEEINEEVEIEIPEINIDDLDGKITTETLIKLNFLIK